MEEKRYTEMKRDRKKKRDAAIGRDDGEREKNVPRMFCYFPPLYAAEVGDLRLDLSHWMSCLFISLGLTLDKKLKISTREIHG